MTLSKALRWSGSIMVLGALLLMMGCSAENVIVMNPKGPIAEQQRDLIVISTLLTSLIIVPVLLLTAFIVWRYRDKKGNKAKYTPEWAHSTKLEVIWWGIPIIIVAILGFITVKATFALEPSKPLPSDQKPITIQVTSLDWKWLFQYPDEGIATVNLIHMPEGVPIRFEVTADSPMNSFWVPQLGGQIYAMSGMAMSLYLQADEAGDYWGSGANFTGREFAQMYFDVKATSREEFDQWVSDIKASSPVLTLDDYKQLAKPAPSDVQTFSEFPEGLFEMTVTKYGSSHNHGLSWKEIQKINLLEP